MTKYQSLPWIEKYRPSSLKEIVHHPSILTIIQKFIEVEKSLPHLLLHGSPGTGKTSVILSCCKQLYKEYFPFMVLILNASDERNVDSVRKQLIQFASTTNIVSSPLSKLIILDEADSMSLETQEFLLDILVKYNDNVRFCFIGNYQYSLLAPLQQRLVKLHFTPIPYEEAVRILHKIADQEGFQLNEDCMQTIYSLSEGGDMRKMINIMQNIYCSIPPQEDRTCIHNDYIQRLFPMISYKKIVQQLFHYFMNHNDIENCYDYIQHIIVQENIYFLHFIEEIVLEMIQSHITQQKKIEIFLEKASVLLVNTTHTINYEIQSFALCALLHEYLSS